jgi:hypothetical protein
LLFGSQTDGRADAITLGSGSVNKGVITCSGTFSVDVTRKLVGINMIVTDSNLKVVSTTPGTVPNGTTQWASNSSAQIAGTYTVTAEIMTTDLQGKNPLTIPSMNYLKATM